MSVESQIEMLLSLYERPSTDEYSDEELLSEIKAWGEFEIERKSLISYAIALGAVNDRRVLALEDAHRAKFPEMPSPVWQMAWLHGRLLMPEGVEVSDWIVQSRFKGASDNTIAHALAMNGKLDRALWTPDVLNAGIVPVGLILLRHRVADINTLIGCGFDIEKLCHGHQIAEWIDRGGIGRVWAVDTNRHYAALDMESSLNMLTRYGLTPGKLNLWANEYAPSGKLVAYLHTLSLSTRSDFSVPFDLGAHRTFLNEATHAPLDRRTLGMAVKKDDKWPLAAYVMQSGKFRHIIPKVDMDTLKSVFERMMLFFEHRNPAAVRRLVNNYPWYGWEGEHVYGFNERERAQWRRFVNFVTFHEPDILLSRMIGLYDTDLIKHEDIERAMEEVRMRRDRVNHALEKSIREGDDRQWSLRRRLGWHEHVLKVGEQFAGA